MKAIRIHQTGQAEVLQPEELPRPEPGDNEVMIKVAAAGVNFIDIYHRTGLYDRAVPFTPGLEAAGLVEAVGPGVTEFKVGDRVASSSVAGAYAEYALIPESKAVPVPEGVSLAQAAASLLQGMTAHYLVHSTYPLSSEDVCLVHAAAGGTGQLLVQMAKKAGATVIGTVSAEEKAQLAYQAGTDHVIRYTETDFEAETMRLTSGAGVNVVYDSVGPATFYKSLNVLRPRGYLVLFGQSSGKVPPFDLNRLGGGGSLYVTRPSLFHYIAGRQELLWRAGDLFDWLASGAVTHRIDQELPLAQAAQAHRLLEDRKTAGKLLLVP